MPICPASRCAASPAEVRFIVTTNMFGDTLSGMCRYLTGRLKLLPSADIGDNHALFESIHGSVPDIAGHGSANSVAANRSAALLLTYLGVEAERSEKAMQQNIACGVMAPDFGGAAFTNDVRKIFLHGPNKYL